tara:strand:- start:1893 stop:2936 length:1044 start_codon:yes stop_codon:yes gene_type:complete
MAVNNLHKNLPDDQVHMPRGFRGAVGGSLLTKNQSKKIEWNRSNFTIVTTITCTDDVSGTTGGRYFYFHTKSTSYQVWFDVDGGDTLVIDSGYTGCEVDISSGDNATTIGTALKTKLSTLTGVTASSASGVVTVNVTSAESSDVIARDGATRYRFSTVKTPVGNEYLTTDDDGNIGWETQPAVNTNSGMFCGFGYGSPRSTDVLDYMTGQTTGDKYPVLHNKNHSTSMPSVLTPVIAMQAAAFRAGDTITVSDLSVTAWCDEASASTAPVTVFFMTARPATGTGTWALTEFTSTGTMNCENDEIVMISKTSAFANSGVLTKGDLIIPVSLSGSDDNFYYSWTMKFTF